MNNGFTVTINEGIAEIVINRPPVNALNDAGFPSADPGAVGAVVVWLLGAGEEDRQKFLGRTIWAPALLDRLTETPV